MGGDRTLRSSRTSFRFFRRSFDQPAPIPPGACGGDAHGLGVTLVTGRGAVDVRDDLVSMLLMRRGVCQTTRFSYA